MIYTYSIAQDTLNAKADSYALEKEIQSSAITIALDYITINSDELLISFKATLSTQEETDLDSLISVHSGVAVNDPDQVEAKITSTPPFAEPDFRTKRDGLGAWHSLNESENEVMDFILAEERYVTGGEIIYKDAKEGDYISAEVYDSLGLIPEAYRAELCEAWPIVAMYVPKKWLKPCDGYESFTIDTYPLNAKISAGLSLRITYHSSAVVGERKVVVNYHLTMKLV